MKTIDADAHVIETPKTWSYMREDEQDFCPQIFARDPDDGAPRASSQRDDYWVVEQRLLTKSNLGKDVPVEARDMLDIERRLSHMDEIGIDIQVLYPSIFLRPISAQPDADYALARSYNRWLADIWKQSGDRLRWVAVPPLLSLQDPGIVREELEFCKENGACGIFMRGMECERLLSHRYFFDLYDIAQQLDLAICLHAGVGSFPYHDLLRPQSALMTFKFSVMGSFNGLLEEEVPARFPELRWAFIETSAQWVPYVLGEARLRLALRGRKAPDDLLDYANFYITTQKTDNLPWLLSEIGDDHLIIGTDYGHKDTATEVEVFRRMSADGDLPQESVSKILEANPARLYALT
jgi:predicted TIM-barrel fold metal-dependent hydrolase